MPVTLALAFALSPAASTTDFVQEQSAAARAFVAGIAHDDALQRLLDDSISAILAHDSAARAARIGVALITLEPDGSARFADHNGDAAFYPASVVKFVYLMAAYASQEQGKLVIDANLDRLLDEMIHVSSNRATQSVVRTITRTEAGPELGEAAYAEFRERRLTVKRWLESLGILRIHSIHPTYDGGGDLYGRDIQLLRDRNVAGGLPANPGEFPNRQAMTATDTARLLALLATDHGLRADSAEAVRRRMQRDPAQQAYQRFRIAGGAMQTAGVEVYSKTGTWGPIFADAGIVRGSDGRQLILAVFIESTPPYRGSFISDLARMFTETLLGGVR